MAYLEGLTEAKARFVQTDGRGRATTGQLFMKRPGKARFAYDPPSGLLVVSDGGGLGAGQAPANLRPVPAGRNAAVAVPGQEHPPRPRRDHHPGGPHGRRILDHRPGREKETAGTITLSFTDAPIALAGWTVTDAQNRPTRVQLQNLERASGLERSLFVLKDPRPRIPGEERSRLRKVCLRQHTQALPRKTFDILS